MKRMSRQRQDRIADGTVAVGWGVSGLLLVSAAMRACVGTADGAERIPPALRHHANDGWTVLALLVLSASLVIWLRRPRHR